MIIIKVLGIILTISSSAAMGFYFSLEVRSRTEELKELKKIILTLRGDIRYTMTPLPEAINSLAKRQEGKFRPFLIKVEKELTSLGGLSFKDIWMNSVFEELKTTSLNKKDKLHLGQLGENLGYLDKEMQMNTIDLYISQLETEIEEANKTVKEKTHLYNCLGVMLGIFVTIIII